jgi:hypothetical protein
MTELQPGRRVALDKVVRGPAVADADWWYLRSTISVTEKRGARNDG